MTKLLLFSICFLASLSTLRAAELQPVILSIYNIEKIYEGYSFYLQFDVEYQGADYITVEVEEEFNSAVRNYRIEEPSPAHIKTGKISALYFSWITVTVKNQYGEDSKVIEISPDEEMGSTEVIENDNFTFWCESGELHIEASMPTQIELYDFSGKRIISKTVENNDIIPLQKSGFYIIGYFTNNQWFNNKIILR